MQKQIINVPKGIRFLSQITNSIHDRCILNKGITGCGGTTVEINSPRNSIILVPIVNLIKSKQVTTNIFGVYGDVKNNQIKDYITTFTGFKKIMATYDSLPRLIEVIGDNIFKDYFLLIDEYHTFTDYYSFRRNAIRGILNNYSKFDNFCFMTATPIKDDYMLKELEHLDVIEYNWEGSSKVNISIKDTPYVQKELLSEIGLAKNCNLHIFVNSIEFIKESFQIYKLKILEQYVHLNLQLKHHKYNHQILTALYARLIFIHQLHLKVVILWTKMDMLL